MNKLNLKKLFSSLSMQFTLKQNKTSTFLETKRNAKQFKISFRTKQRYPITSIYILMQHLETKKKLWEDYYISEKIKLKSRTQKEELNSEHS